MHDDLSQYDYELPPDQIADHPLAERDSARLLVVDRRTGSFAHRTVRDLPELLEPGDCLVLNDTQVLPARLFGTRAATGGKWEGLYLQCTPEGNWRLICETRGRLQPGEEISIRPAHQPDSADRLTLTLLDRDSEGIWTARVTNSPGNAPNPLELLRRFGTMPLPPYIGRKLAEEPDWQRYQTTFSQKPGAVAAPTAGLHFTPELLTHCTDRGLHRATVTLHVGIGTFRPITAERLSEHRMHGEWCELSDETAKVLNEMRNHGNRIVAVGTTSVRTLETAARQQNSDHITAWTGETNLFIRPPYKFRAVDVLLTNFHLPRSTLLVLVSTFAGIELIREAYACALRENYRFYSYGDAMLIL